MAYFLLLLPSLYLELAVVMTEGNSHTAGGSRHHLFLKDVTSSHTAIGQSKSNGQTHLREVGEATYTPKRGIVGLMAGRQSRDIKSSCLNFYKRTYGLLFFHCTHKNYNLPVCVNM